jgi:hypothetical protein
LTLYVNPLGASIGHLEGIVRAMPVPPNDRMTQRFRQELPILILLREFDTRMIGRAQVLLDMLTGKDYAWMIEHLADLKQGIALMMQDTHERERLLKL